MNMGGLYPNAQNLQAAMQVFYYLYNPLEY